MLTPPSLCMERWPGGEVFKRSPKPAPKANAPMRTVDYGRDVVSVAREKVRSQHVRSAQDTAAALVHHRPGDEVQQALFVFEREEVHPFGRGRSLEQRQLPRHAHPLAVVSPL